MKYVRVDSRQSLEVRDGFPEEVASDGPPQRSVQESEGKRKGIQAERSGLRKHLGVRKPVIIQHLRVGASVCQALSWGLERDPSPTFLGRWGGGGCLAGALTIEKLEKLGVMNTWAGLPRQQAEQAPQGEGA